MISCDNLTCLQAIDEKMRSMNLGGASAEVENVDAQYSLEGGVTVLVTGHLTVLVRFIHAQMYDT